MKVNGTFDINGQFLVHPDERKFKDRCDKFGYLLDPRKKRQIDSDMAQRLRVRALRR